MEDIIPGVITVSIFLLIPIISYAIKCILNYNLFKKVGWILVPFRERSLPSRCNTSLVEEILYKQQKLKISKEFWLGDNEIKHIEEILEVFKKDIYKLYFGGCLSNTQKIRNLHEDWYFMYRLFVFAEKYSEYDNYELRDKIYKLETRNSSYHTHNLTDSGIAFYKLYLISLLYVENNSYTRKLYKYINPKLKEHLQSYLITKKVTFWSYRP